MELLATVAVWIVAAPLIVLTATFVIEVAAGLPARRPGEAAVSGPLPAMAIVMPAHDEATIIDATLARLLPELPENVSLLVVADNCHDDTAAIAKARGAQVVERQDATRRGKGFALAHARDHLAATPPAVVMVLDADGATDRASLATMARAALAGPVQAINLLSPDLAAAPMVQVSNFAFVIKNLVRQRGLYRLSHRANLTGTGMAFPWPTFRDAPLATADIVEDLALGLDLARHGAAPRFEPGATVWSAASSAEGTLKQRTRWEGGFLATSLRRALPALASALARTNPRDAWAALSLAVPPLTLLLLLDLLGLAVLSVSALFGATPWPVLILGVLVLAACLLLALAWRKVGRAFLSARAAAMLPLYMLWKIPLYLRLVTARPTSWLRAGR